MAVISRRPVRFAITRASVLGAVVFCVALVALVAIRSGSDPSRLSGQEAQRAALDSPEVRVMLVDGFTRVRTMPLDDTTVRVSFFDGSRAVAEAAVGRDGRIVGLIAHDGRHPRVGSEVGQRPAVLLALIALFLLATLRLPLLRRANLDAVALAAVVVPIVLLNERYLEWSVLAASVLLAYLGLRCLAVALGPADGEPARWMLDTVNTRGTAMLAGAAAAALVLLAVPGGLVSDVGFASMAGATHLVEGSLPYGGLVPGELVHGDTYPLFAYLAYVPAAVLRPVHDGFGSLDGALWVATGFALAAALALGHAYGRRLAIALLAFPPVMVAASSGSNDAVAAAFMAGAVAFSARAGASSAAVAVAGWVKLGPLAAVPLWVARGPGRALAGVVAVTALLAVAILAIGGPGGFADMARAISFQSERGSPMSIWALVEVPALQLVFQAAVITGIVLLTVRVARDPAAADPRRMAALGATVLLAVQLAANHWSATYLAWVFPLVAVALLAGARPSRSRAPAS